VTKIVINTCYGGFGISKEAAEFMAARGNKRAIASLACGGYKGGWAQGFEGGYDRDDPDLIAVVEANLPGSTFADLKVIEIPDDVEWEIQEYDGTEWVAEKHRTWYADGDEEEDAS
jgi:hypothetical protein